MKSVKEIMRSYAQLNSEGVHVGGSDRESNHSYGDAYAMLVAGERENVKLMMEVGIADGSSLLAWREVFPNALCVGLDIHPSDRAHGERIEFHLGDQQSRADCERAAAGRQFDFIVEDAIHHLPETLLTLFYLWPHVRPGGLYVVEEWEHLGDLWPNVVALWPCAGLVECKSPFGGTESLVVFRKPL